MESEGSSRTNGIKTVQQNKIDYNNKYPDKITILCLNADTLTNKLPEFNWVLNEHSPDIIGVSEVLPKSFSNKIYAEEFNISGY